MDNHNSIKPIVLLLILFVGFVRFVSAQQLSTELHGKLSDLDKQNLHKADDLYLKGRKIEEEIQPASNEVKKSQLKLLEAANCYQNANSARQKIYDNNIKSFWKKYTGEKRLLDFAKKVELASADSFKKASQIRSTAEKERKLANRIALLSKAEKLEGKSLVMMQKVLYTYLNWPAEYDNGWLLTDDEKMPNEVKKAPKEPINTKTNLQAKTDNAVTAKKDSVVKKDTTVKISGATRPKPTMIIMKPRTTPIALNDKSGKPVSKDTTTKVSPAPSANPVSSISTADKPKTKDTISKLNAGSVTKTPIVPVSSPVVPVNKEKTVKDTSLKQQTIPAAKPLSQPAVKPPKVDKVEINTAKDTISKKTAISSNIKKAKTGEVLVGNDSSLYGKIKIKEDQIDKFNEFLKKKYPSKMEDYVINFQELDYSDVNALREAWYRYQFGLQSPDTTAMYAAFLDSVSKEQQELLASSNTKNQDVANQQLVSKGGKPVKYGSTVASNNSDKKGNKKNLVGITKSGENESQNTSVEGFIFRVQIAACRVRLDKETLKGIYNGLSPIMELHEDNWYKYAIGEFTTYKSARQLRDKSNIPGVFVIAYLNGKRIKITPAIAFKKFTVKTDITTLNPNLIQYRIQIASSKTMLSDNYLKNIYNGTVKIEVIKEDGWNKYMLLAGKTFKEANDLLKKVSVPGAFIVVYHQNKRIDVQTAIKLTP